MSQKLDEIGFPINLSSTSKDDVFHFIISHPKLCLTHRNNFKYRFPELYNDFLQMTIPEFASDWKFSQLLWHFLQDDTNFKLGVCKCGNRCKFNYFTGGGYNQHCCTKCADTDPHKLESFKSTCKDKFGVEFPQQNKELKNRAVKTASERYGGVGFASKDLNEKGKQTTYEKYGNRNYNNMNKNMSTCLTKYGVSHYSKTKMFKKQMDENCKERIIKQHITKRKNKTFNSSKIENQLCKWFKDNNIFFEQQYCKDKRYQFPCDFYLPKYDLFIEIQGTWTHGGHPFNQYNEEDIRKLNFWKSKNTKYYKIAVNVWTQRDPLKRKTAKDNNLNYLEIFSSDFDYAISEILKLL